MGRGLNKREPEDILNKEQGYKTLSGGLNCLYGVGLVKPKIRGFYIKNRFF